eukprot:CAMPEP_0195285418 /NCGR_PEP_ID=MMETSP0707-20130614/3257_1 /TAXON_ID=33640 /ORGANISM="Asterionellopsis glacialis, Strain CCMP134" /LENGTH=229 /DNA_ID=CAMNT_0040344907 /DNA_START=254 /DNA_END=943 /DNA_ORIENTATION=-
MTLLSSTASVPTSPTPQTRYREALNMSPTERGRQKVLAHSPRRGNLYLDSANTKTAQPALAIRKEESKKETSIRILEPCWTETPDLKNSPHLCSLPGEGTGAQSSKYTNASSSLESDNELSMKFRIFPLTSPLPQEFDTTGEKSQSLENKPFLVTKSYIDITDTKKKIYIKQNTEMREHKRNVMNRTMKAAIALEEKHKFIKKSAGSIYSSASVVVTKLRECSNKDTTK